MNIVLIGYRGTGKSTVGRLLATQLGRTLISTDQEIVKRTGQSIPDLVAAHGWEHFRDVESEVCQEVGVREHLVIDTGGGAILRPQNVDVLKSKGRLFWMTASVDTISARIGGDTQRPSLTGTRSFVDEIADVLRERTPRYQAAADVTISTDGISPSDLTVTILNHLGMA
ncbi:Shikimate kinase [Nitrospira sp. KM1]|uniref:shikimate kinase n=1 Tax=Nitrospira sp. KM1 TaxID=1936990 RepID=UPI0013A70DCF|nr:shikimate kinase [Nitrospira sp. KM1]BCA55586.1 Shikimate kinase [Nitrospira sp. KM1]